MSTKKIAHTARKAKEGSANRLKRGNAGTKEAATADLVADPAPVPPSSHTQALKHLYSAREMLNHTSDAYLYLLVCLQEGLVDDRAALLSALSNLAGEFWCVDAEVKAARKALEAAS